MGNINYTLLKDYVIFTEIDPKVSYYLQSWSGLGLVDGDAVTGSPYGEVYNPGDIITYNTFSATFIIDENWETFETISKMAINNAPTSSKGYNYTITDIDLHLMNNTYKKEIGFIRMYAGYIQSIMNIDHPYNTEDNTTPYTLTAIIKYQYHEFFRNTEE